MPFCALGATRHGTGESKAISLTVLIEVRGFYIGNLRELERLSKDIAKFGMI